MNIREASAADIPRLLEMEQAVITAERPFNDAIKAQATYYDLQALIASDASRLIVAELDGLIVASGYVAIRTSKQHLQHERHGYLGFMYVEPALRGRGIVQTVMQHLIDWCREQGIQDFYLDVYAANTAAIRAYEKVGFAPSVQEMRLTTDSI